MGSLKDNRCAIITLRSEKAYPNRSTVFVIITVRTTGADDFIRSLELLKDALLRFIESRPLVHEYFSRAIG